MLRALPRIGIADRNTLAGVVRAYAELDNPEVKHKPKLLIGARLVFTDGTPDILVYPARPRRLWPAVPAARPAARWAPMSRRASAI